MRKLQIVLLSVFAAGVLLGGIGTGIAFGEYSSMRYEGTVYLDEKELVTEEFVYDFEPAEGEKIVLAHSYWGDDENDGNILQEDASVPEGQIVYDITYNPNRARPELVFEKAAPEWEAAPDAAELTVEEAAQEKTAESRVSGYLYVSARYIGDDFDLLMKNKDKILADMKQGKFASYRTSYITKVRVRVNPETRKYLRDDTQEYR